MVEPKKCHKDYHVGPEIFQCLGLNCTTFKELCIECAKPAKNNPGLKLCMLCYYNQADSSDSDEESSSDEKDTNTGGFKVVRAAFDADKKDMNKFQSVSR